MTSPTTNQFPSPYPSPNTTPTQSLNSRRTLSLFTEPTCDYFQYKPYKRSSTPSSPIDLLVATFEDINISPYTMDVSNILKLQTEAAHSSPRPVPQPIQTASFSSGTSSTSSSSSNSSLTTTNSRRLSRTVKPAAPPVSSLKCTRCKRSVSVDSNSSHASDVISFGTLHYCSSCAAILEQRAI